MWNTYLTLCGGSFGIESGQALEPSLLTVGIQIEEHDGDWLPWEQWGEGERRFRNRYQKFLALVSFVVPPRSETGWHLLAVEPGERIRKGAKVLVVSRGECQLRGFPEDADVCGWCGANNTSQDGSSLRDETNWGACCSCQGN
jgi:hypothetical protein